LLDDLLLADNVYHRQLAKRTFNGDLGDDYCDDYEAAIAPDGSCAGAYNPNACAAAMFADETGVNHASLKRRRRAGATMQLTESLPKTRSGKIMRRLLRSIAKGEKVMQDISMLENPAIVEQLVNAV